MPDESMTGSRIRFSKWELAMNFAGKFVYYPVSEDFRQTSLYKQNACIPSKTHNHNVPDVLNVPKKIGAFSGFFNAEVHHGWRDPITIKRFVRPS